MPELWRNGLVALWVLAMAGLMCLLVVGLVIAGVLTLVWRLVRRTLDRA